MKRFNLPTMYLLLVIACGCRKPHMPPVVVFPQAGLAYIQLSEGRHFIYQDSTTARLDTIVVTESSLQTYMEPVSGESFRAYTGQQFTLVLSDIDSGKTTPWLSGVATAYISPADIYLLPSDGSGGYQFRYPPCNCGSTANIPSVVEETIASMTVEGKSYTNLVATINVDAADHQSAYYWASGVGLIKRVEITPAGTSTYTLVKSY